MICSLCLKEILKSEKVVSVDDRIRHKTCSDKLEKMVSELKTIYEDANIEHK